MLASMATEDEPHDKQGLAVAHWAGGKTVIHRPESAVNTPAGTRMGPALRCQLGLPRRSDGTNRSASSRLYTVSSRCAPPRDGRSREARVVNGDLCTAHQLSQ